MKKIYLEIMRIVACALVIFNHLPGYTLYMHSSGIKQWIYIFCTMFTRINVPLFFMISGALLLHKNEDFVKVYKRISRIFIIMLIFEIGLFILSNLLIIVKTHEFNFHLLTFVKQFLSGKINGAGAYWYLYAYLGFLIVLPLMQGAVKKLKKYDIFALLIMHFIISSLIPILNLFKVGGGYKYKWSFANTICCNKSIFLHIDRLLY